MGCFGFFVWLALIVWVLAPAFPGYDVWFWALTFVIPPLVLIPIVEAVAR
jgi:hypothetical protein